MSEQDAEAKRAKQLEEARKRVEELKKKKNKKGKGKKNKNNNVTDTTGSVSYTHLDVYKRQERSYGPWYRGG